MEILFCRIVFTAKGRGDLFLDFYVKMLQKLNK